MIKIDKRLFILLFGIILLSTVFILLNKNSTGSLQAPAEFDSARAYNDVLAQVAFGPRVPGSQAHADTVNYIQSELKAAGWKVTVQQTELEGQSIQNIIASRGKNTQPVTVLGAHYDSRLAADQDPDPLLATQPVPGADDGASAVAVLLELARVMPAQAADKVWLVFFDAEDQGGLPGWNWILGSKAFVANTDQEIKAAVIVDMIGDKDLNIYREKSSTPQITTQIWSAAANLGYANQFIDTEKYNMLDDHTPFLQAGIPAVDIIDFDYPYWHTAADLADKISPQSLKIVGDTLLAWLAEN